jgi:hypothetical protein
MSFLNLALFAVFAMLVFGCKTRGQNAGLDSTVVQKIVPFNAYNIWRDGGGEAVLTYPDDFDVREGQARTDGFHFVEWSEFWGKTKEDFLGVPTTGVTVKKDTLVYPPNEKSGEILKLRFTSETFRHFGFDKARSYCSERGMRLPTIRELFDFCTAGLVGANYGPGFDELYTYPEKAQCYRKGYWSTSLVSETRNVVWTFYGEKGTAEPSARFGSSVMKVRCVTNPSVY